MGAKLKGGEYVARSYQPSVKNPNTLRQQVSRSKMGFAAGIAAAAADAINIGYAKASNGTKMYPRNMFVKEMIPVSNGHITLNNNVPALSGNVIPFSAKQGLETLPQVTIAYSEESNVFNFTATNADQVTLGTGERLGLVVVPFIEPTAETPAKAVVAMGDAAEGVTLDGDLGSDFMGAKVYAFYKVIPAAVNGVATTTIPWKYPSNTGATRMIGTMPS